MLLLRAVILKFVKLLLKSLVKLLKILSIGALVCLIVLIKAKILLSIYTVIIYPVIWPVINILTITFFTIWVSISYFLTAVLLIICYNIIIFGYSIFNVFFILFSIFFKIFCIEGIFYSILSLFVMYILLGFLLFFYWGTIGLRGIFYLAEIVILTLINGVLVLIYFNIKYHLAMSCCIGELYISDDLNMCCVIHLDMLSLIGVLVVLLLTGIALTFGIEYMSREAFSYNVIVILIAFSSSIVWFILSYDLGFMTIFWEFSGIFSILLVDTFYNRIRTTQAVSRTYVISRFSDYWIFIALSEMIATLNTESLAILFSAVREYCCEAATLATYPMDITTIKIMVFSIFAAASCKSAQFILFVWLPDAMEAPTPASALIHSSTLVVMGIFMIMRFTPVFRNCEFILYVALVVGSITIVYGALSSIYTGDLKKAVAYSTISQVGYLYCGCGLLAMRETLIYLVIHAICKAMLFVFVGYIVHLFGGTTSLRKMGGVYYIIPDVALYMVTLCLILAGAPYTVGFIAKELVVTRLISVYSPVMYIVVTCWIVAFVCTPIYLYRICILPIFGRPRATRRVYRNILLLKNKASHFAIKSFDLNKFNNPLVFFMYHTKDLYISSRVTSVIHIIIMLFVCYFGEFFILLVTGFFGNDVLFNGGQSNIAAFALTSLSVNTAYTIRAVQLFAVISFILVTAYIFVINIIDTGRGHKYLTVFIVVILLVQVFAILFNILFSTIC